MAICIQKETFKKIRDTGIFLIKDSKKREQALVSFLGEKEGKILNNKFEKILELKKGNNSFVNMVKRVVSDPKKQLELIKNRKIANEAILKSLKEIEDVNIIRNKKVLNLEQMTNDIYSKKYELKISEKQSSKIIELTKIINKEKDKIINGSHSIEYGKAMSELGYLSDSIKNPTVDLGFLKTLNYNSKQFLNKIKSIDGIFNKTAFATIKGLKFVTSHTLKTLKASLDLSFGLIQGPAILTTNPKAFTQSMGKALEAVFGKESAMDNFRVELFRNNNYKKAIIGGLRTLLPEEQLSGASIIEKLPFSIGNLYKRADRGFTIFLQNSRFKEFEKVLLKTEKKLGKELDITNPIDVKKIEEIAAHANKISGTTNLGSFEKHAGLLNDFLFAARYAASDVRIFSDILNPFLSKEAKTRAVGVLTKNAGSVFLMYLLINKMNPKGTSLNPNNAGFLRIKLKDGTSIPFIPPKGKWLYQFVAKMAEGYEVNSRGKKTIYGKGYKAKTKGDVFLRLLRGKLSPQFAFLTDLLVGRDFTGKKITTGNEALKLITPIALTDTVERFIQQKDDPITKNALLGILDIFGASSYKIGKKNNNYKK